MIGFEIVDGPLEDAVAGDGDGLEEGGEGFELRALEATE